MTRLSRALIPLLAGAALLLVHAVLRHRQDLLTALELNAKTVLEFVLFLAAVPLILGAVRLFDFLAFDVMVSRRSGVRAPILLREIVSLVLFLMLLGWAVYEILGYEVTAILAGGTVVAAVLGLAMQETLGNLFAGIALHIEEDFKVGDVVRSGEFFGIVESVRWRGTRLRTYDNNIVIVPNSLLARERIEVFPRNNMNARVLRFPIDFDVPPAKVIPILLQAAENVEGVERGMPCIARIGNYAEFAAMYEIKYFMADYAQRDRIDAEIRRAVWYALQRNGIRLAVPVRALERFRRPASRSHPELDAIIGRLSGIDIFASAPPSAKEAIANGAHLGVYSRGETVISEGGEGRSMFIVHEGSVSVRVDGREVAQLGEGEFFGEMALLTGARRTADVVALTDLVAIEIDKDALQPVFVAQPELAASISARIEERRASTESHIAAESHGDTAPVLSRIRSWFGL